MKKIYTFSTLMFALLCLYSGIAMAQNYSSSINFSSTFPGQTSFTNNTFGFTSGTTGKTITIDLSSNGGNYTFTGVTFNITNGNSLAITYSGNTTRTVTFTNSTINVTSPGAGTVSTFNITNNANRSLTTTFSGSTLNLKDYSTMTMSGNNTNTLNLTASSSILVGDVVVGSAGNARISIGSNAGINITTSSNSSSIRLAYAGNKITAVNGSGGSSDGYINNASSRNSDYYINGGWSSNTVNAANQAAGANIYSRSNNNVVVSGPSVTSVSTNGAVFASITPLPVVLTNFNAVLNTNNTASITWTTQQEVNTSYFNIQRSADGIGWQSIGTVPAKLNSASVSDYNFTDQQPLSGVNYYRLKAIDVNANYNFTAIKILRTLMVKGFSVFPNPARDYVNLSVSNAASDLNIRLMSETGKLLQIAKISSGSSTTISLPVNNYAKGVYLLQIMDAHGTQQTSKVLIAH